MRKRVLSNGTIVRDMGPRAPSVLPAIAREFGADALAELIERETAAANAYADEQEARFATGVYCPTEDEIAKHRRKP